MKTIEFFSDVYGLADTVPIIKTSDALPRWVSLARNDFKQASKVKTHIARCPGIFDLFKQGYLIPAWHDITIRSDGERFGWEIPSENLMNLRGTNSIAQAHDKNTIGKHLPRPPWANPNVLKINTPWHVIAPKGVKLLMTSVPYPDTFEIEALNGILDPAVSTEINLQLNFNILRGEHLIKAGTPLAMIIPLSENEFKLVVRDKNSYDEMWSVKRKFVNSMSYVLNRQRIKQLYEKHWRNK
ncbi:MAG: hypothetical protein EBU90_12785 [Proteobacteria bacterium]|nr:hypothetical protein [Pseudomonadota bacterium]NBP14873.1 hypothetical protein [bacterium]